MLKAFTKVFHKSQGPHDEQLVDATLNAHQPPARQLLTRAIERRHPSASGQDAAGAVGAAGVHNLVSPRRNAAEVGASGAHAQTPALGPIASSAKRTSVLQRSEQHPLQPRLHLKGPAPGVDGRFALTADNIEWHLRLIPPMKESKYDWIVRYVQEQQQNVAAAATESSQHQRDIESSMLMTGQMQYEYIGPNYLDHSYLDHRAAAAHQQQQQKQQHQQNQQQLQQLQQLQFPMMRALVQPRNLVANNHVSAPLAQHQLTLPTQLSLANNIDTTTNAQREADVQPLDNEEDDNTPLAAINAGISPRHQPALPSHQPTVLNIGHTSCLDKYMIGSLHDPLPEPISPIRDARLSLTSFQSNMAVNMDTPDIRAVSRSHSLSHPYPASVLESGRCVAPVERFPAAHDSGPPLFADNPTSARQLSCPIPTGSARVSINIGSGSRQIQRRDDNSSDDDRDNEPLLPRRASAENVSAEPNAPMPSISINPASRVISDAESDSTPALRVVNQVNSHDSDESADERDMGEVRVVPRTPLLASGEDEDDEDDSPLMKSTDKHGQKPQPLLNVNTSIARPPIASYSYHNNGPDDDDNRPLSSLMMLAHNADDDLSSSLPLPMPRHVIDPDAVVNISDIINETVTPPRTSLGERPTSPLISTGSTRKHSLLLRSFHPTAQGSETTGGAVAGGTDLVEPSLSELSSAVNNAQSAFPQKRRSNLSSVFSGQPAARESTATDRTSSLPRSLKLVTDRPDGTSIPQLQLQPPPQLVPYKFAANEAISENDGGELSIEDSVDSASSKRRQDTGHALAMLESGQTQESSGKRPWAMNRAHSASAASLASSRRAPRGSTLGQQLTDELHMLREDLARSRREYDKVERRSWQVGDPAAVQQPWVRHENTMSDTALPQKLNGLRPDSANGQGGDTNEIATHDETTKVPSPWSYADRQRPMSTQQLYTSRWFGKGSSSRVFHARQQSKDDVTAAQQPASPHSVHATSLSSRISNKLGKLKRSFKHGAGV